MTCDTTSVPTSQLQVKLRENQCLHPRPWCAMAPTNKFRVLYLPVFPSVLAFLFSVIAVHYTYTGEWEDSWNGANPAPN